MPLAKISILIIVAFTGLGWALDLATLFLLSGIAISAAICIWNQFAAGIVLRAVQAKRLTDASANSPIFRAFLGDAKILRDMAGLKTCDIYLIDTHAPLAFSMGRRNGFSQIVVTTGLFKTLTRLEIAAVMGHEMGHIRAGDSGLNALRLNLSLLVSKLHIRSVVSLFRSALPSSTLLSNVLLKPECRADAFSAKLCQDGKILASALKKLERGVRAVQWSALDKLPFIAEVAVIDPFAARNSDVRPEASQTAHRVAELYRLELPEAA